MNSELFFEWDGRPDAGKHVSGEMYAVAGGPPYTADDEPEPEPTGGQGRPRTIGAVAARRDGALLGWAWVYEDPDHERVARVQATYVPRQVRRLKTGYYDLLPPTAEEFEMVTGLYRRAADEARAAGYRTLRWGGRDTGPDGQAATALNAHGHGECARYWSTEPATWQPPAGLPDVQVHQLPAHLTLATADAEVSAFIDGHAAHINAGESIRHENAEPRALAALIAELVTRLRRDHPEVTELTIWEFDDASVRQALPLAGLRITARTMDYDLPLTPS
ncbi:hypothetical protein [Streptomyces nigrescens]